MADRSAPALSADQLAQVLPLIRGHAPLGPFLHEPGQFRDLASQIRFVSQGGAS